MYNTGEVVKVTQKVYICQPGFHNFWYNYNFLPREIFQELIHIIPNWQRNGDSSLWGYT